MNRDELLELKEQLLGEKKYVLVDLEDMCINSDPMTFDEIEKQENTDEIVTKIEDVVEQSLKEMSNEGDVERLTTSGSALIFCEEKAARILCEKAQKYVDYDDVLTDKHYDALYELIKEIYANGDIITDYVCYDSFYASADVKYGDDAYDCSDLAKFKGIISLNKFIPMIQNLGYDISGGNNNNTLSDSMNFITILESIYPLCYINIDVDLTNKKTK